MGNVLLINDLSGVGNCSLTANIQIFSVLGIRCYPLPTAVFSSQTQIEGFVQNTNTKFNEFLSHMTKTVPLLDCLYTGYFASSEQIRQVSEFVTQTLPEMVFVDPVMADNGVPYPNCSEELLYEMKGLVSRADVITPNLTEACLLAGTNYADYKTDTLKRAKMLAQYLHGTYGAVCVITGVIEGDTIYTVYCDGDTHYTHNPLIKQIYSGAGDVFSSVMCGELMLTHATSRSCKIATNFAYECLVDTPIANMHGLNTEPHLYSLSKMK
ncbi:MAG: bifunctional hydroxymethylpyrimidine kinase/phosphomethylpyrimidine kinase [Clostridia bacterium]